MLLKLPLIYLFLKICECSYIYSSFWAPLFDPRILNYRVDATFNSDAGRNAREQYAKDNGYRGERLIADLGNGRLLNSREQDKINGDIKVYYTYPAANNDINR